MNIVLVDDQTVIQDNEDNLKRSVYKLHVLNNGYFCNSNTCPCTLINEYALYKLSYEDN